MVFKKTDLSLLKYFIFFGLVSSHFYSVSSTRPRLRLKCPQARGQFPHPTRCDSFVNCWDGDAAEGRCPPSLLFNPKKSTCDWPRNVVCPGEDASEEDLQHPNENENLGSDASPTPENLLEVTTTTTAYPIYKPKRPSKVTTSTATPLQEVDSTTEKRPALFPLKPKPPNRFDQLASTVRPLTSALPLDPSEPEIETSLSTTAQKVNAPQKVALSQRPASPVPSGSNEAIQQQGQPSSTAPTLPRITCQKESSVTPLPGFCDAVIVCVNRTPFLLRCLPGQEFDAVMGSCVHAAFQQGSRCNKDV